MSAGAALPLSAREFAELMSPFEPFERPPVVAVALSGGRDSTCLALLAHEWAVVRGGAAFALIVDHGLRAEAAAEADATHRRMESLGIAGEVLRWIGAKPAQGIQEAARVARYALLSEACVRRGILHLLVAHHAADQAETVVMRHERGSGPDGLAGMAALVEHRDVRLLRPLLGVARERLTATLEARGVGWVEDPSNADLRFARSRLRAAPRQGRTPVVTGDRGETERRLAETAVAILAFTPDGSVSVDCEGVARLDTALAGRLLSRVVQAVGTRDHPPRRERLERAVARLSRVEGRGRTGKSRDFTLSGCRLMLRKAPGDGRLCWIVRCENGRKSGKNRGQPLIPAAFFACGTPVGTHLD